LLLIQKLIFILSCEKNSERYLNILHKAARGGFMPVNAISGSSSLPVEPCWV
jgi:hypothetical protein